MILAKIIRLEEQLRALTKTRAGDEQPEHDALDREIMKLTAALTDDERWVLECARTGLFPDNFEADAHNKMKATSPVGVLD